MTGAPRRGRATATRRARRASSDRTTAAAIAIHGGTITATQMAVLRTDVSASAAPTAGEREVAKVEVTPQRRPRQHGDRERREGEQQRQEHPHRRVGEVGRLPLDDAFLPLGAPVVAAKTKSHGP